jgi:O-methyltransferase domain/Dimerisation domain
MEAHTVTIAADPQNEQAQQQAAQLLMQLGTGYMASAALHVAVKLKVADRIADGTTTTTHLARDCGVQEDALYRILRMLASVGVFEETAPRTFGLTPAAAALQDVPGSMHDMALWICDPFHFRVYADTMHSVQTGAPAIEKTFGMPVFEYLARDPELSSSFNNAMVGFSGTVLPPVLEVYDFSDVNVLVDVAGGLGGVLTGILERYPSMRGILADLDHVIKEARPRLASLGLADRCRTEVIDMFTAVPAGGDAYIMKHIIHDWDDERSGLLLRNIRKVLPSNGRVILIEAVVAPGNQPDFAKLIDIEMMVLPGGRERSADEFAKLFATNGFELTRIVPTKSPLSVVEAKAAR